MNIETMSTAELRKLEHHPDLNLRRRAWREILDRWKTHPVNEHKTPYGAVIFKATENRSFGLPWIGCA